VQPVELRQPVGQELLVEIEAAAADDVAVDVSAHALREFDAAGVACGGYGIGDFGNGGFSAHDQSS
jgi:hypothetical protein